MTKKLLIKLIAMLLAFGLGFLTCFITVKSESQSWDEVEAKRARLINKINRMIEGLNEECSEMTVHNEEAVVKPEEGR